MLGAGNEEAAALALATFPGGLQVCDTCINCVSRLCVHGFFKCRISVVDAAFSSLGLTCGGSSLCCFYRWGVA